MNNFKDLVQILEDCGELFVDEIVNISSEFDVGVCTSVNVSFKEEMYTDGFLRYMENNLCLTKYESMEKVNMYTVYIGYR